MYSPILSKFYTKLFKQLHEIHVRLLLKLNDVKAKDIVANSHGRARRDFTVCRVGVASGRALLIGH